MFSQMCDAVAACHAQQVFHRDIKPENFIVTDGTFTTPDGRSERKVVVKLTDFGLSTTDLESADMDCGSAPYMSYGSFFFFSVSNILFLNKPHKTECRNNVAPTYRPHAADVWSLGIVLINMYVALWNEDHCVLNHIFFSAGCITSTLGPTPRRAPARPLIFTYEIPSPFSCSASWA